MRFSVGMASDIGARASNQDRMGCCFSRESLLMVVADGMGGHLRGEVAAQLSMEAAAAAFQLAARPRLEDPATFLDEIFRAAHRKLHRYREVNGLPECPHTTIVACIVQDDMAWWAHAGDSRLHLIRHGRSVMRTRDHSQVEHLLSLGLITEVQARTHPELNMVLNCLGSPFEPSVEVSEPIALQSGDVIVLSSDGFWSGVDEAGLADALHEGPLTPALTMLVREAVKRNGAIADNATALALRWNGDHGDQGRGVGSDVGILSSAVGVDGDGDILSSAGLADGSFTTTIGTGLLHHLGNPHDC